MIASSKQGKAGVVDDFNASALKKDEEAVKDSRVVRD